MEKYAYYIVMACAFGGCTLKEKEPDKCSQEENWSKLNLESLSVNPQYTCNNKTFDWVVKTMIAKIAQQVEEIGELESKLLEKQQVRYTVKLDRPPQRDKYKCLIYKSKRKATQANECYSVWPWLYSLLKCILLY